MLGLASLVREATRLTVGATLEQKQDRALNAALMSELINLKPGNPARLDKSDYVRVAEAHGVEPWKLHGLADIESRRGGFDNFGRATILPELHQFSKRTGHVYDKEFPALSIPVWIPPGKVKAGHPYKLDNLARWDLLAQQAALNFDAALEASSWGALQVMGFNYRKVNFDSAFDLVRYVYQGERQQLDIAVRLLLADDGLEPLIKGDYYRAAIVQNGPGKPKEYAAEWKHAANERKGSYA